MTDIFSNQFGVTILREMPSEIRAALNIRRFIPPAGYMSPNIVVGSFGLEVTITARRINNDADITGSQANLFAMGCWQAFHRWPMFAVTPELCEAMFLTDPPLDIKWDELQWPLAAATFLLPDNEQVRREFRTSKPLAISVGQLIKPPDNTPTTIAQLLGRIRMPGDAYVRDVVTVIYWDDAAKAPMFHDITAKPEWTLSHSLSREVFRHEAGDCPILGDTDFDRMAVAVKMAVNLLCFMSSTYQPLIKPENEESEGLLRKAQVKHGRQKDALYGVRWLGQGYRLRKHPLGGHHASPRDHWRRGHYRAQPFGPERKLRKAIWIEPTWVGGDP